MDAALLVQPQQLKATRASHMGYAIYSVYLSLRKSDTAELHEAAAAV
jgi:hypothetical protein